jgi:hypothetical protein
MAKGYTNDGRKTTAYKEILIILGDFIHEISGKSFSGSFRAPQDSPANGVIFKHRKNLIRLRHLLAYYLALVNCQSTLRSGRRDEKEEAFPSKSESHERNSIADTPQQ